MFSKIKIQHNSRFFWILLVSLLLEAPVIWNFFLSFKAWPDKLTNYLMLYHIASALVWLFYEPWNLKGFFSTQRYWSRLFTFFILCFPVFGFVVVLGIFFYTSNGVSPLVKNDELFDNSENKIQTIYQFRNNEKRREEVLSELDFVPLAEIMESDDIALKRGAIERLCELKTPEAIGLLLKNRSNPSPEVRFYVTGSLVKIKADFEEQLDAARKQMQQETTKVSARIFLARLYWNFVKSGLLDDSTMQNYIKEAVFHLKYAIESPFDNPESYLLLADIFYDQKNWVELNHLFDTVNNKKGSLSLELMHLKTKMYFELKKIRELQEMLSTIKANSEDKNWAALALWWGCA